QLEVNVARLGVDLLTVNSGKLYGPKQVGLLWVARSVHLSPQIVGGGQESGLRSGTENVAGVIGFAKAVELIARGRKTESKQLMELRDTAEKQFITRFPDAVLSGHKKHRLPNFLHISFPGIDAERLVFALESRGVMVATGSACAANKGTRSHVLTAIGLAPEVADGSLRLTLGHLSSDENMKRAVEIISEEVLHEYERTAK
ncbi:MAG: aminotransferase class V-fold PLP-dependent enzyme, partial [Candidatus Saccharibacteria bacterium]